MTGQALVVRNIKRHRGHGDTAIFHVTANGSAGRDVLNLYLTRTELDAVGIELPVHLVADERHLEVVR